MSFSFDSACISNVYSYGFMKIIQKFCLSLQKKEMDIFCKLKGGE